VQARNEKRRAARKAPKPKPKPKAKKKAPAAFCQGGVQTADAPPQWPFGVKPDQPEPPPAVEPDGEPVITADTPLEFLLSVVREPRLKLAVRMQAAAIAAPFVHAKPAAVGKKEAQAAAAKEAGKTSKFAAVAPPRLVANNRGT
jgi:phage terminase small subunit